MDVKLIEDVAHEKLSFGTLIAHTFARHSDSDLRAERRYHILQHLLASKTKFPLFYCSTLKALYAGLPNVSEQVVRRVSPNLATAANYIEAGLEWFQLDQKASTTVLVPW